MLVLLAAAITIPLGLDRYMPVPEDNPLTTERIELGRWFSIGCASSGVMLSVVYLWSDADPAATKIRLISARKATPEEIRYYHEGV